MITATRSGGTITAYIDFVPYTIHESHPNFKEVDDYLRNNVGRYDVETLRNLIHIPTAIATKSQGKLTVEGNEVFYGEYQLEGYDVDRFLDIFDKNEDAAPMGRFLERRFMNPSMGAQKELYMWLEHARMPILEDGRFLAYKKVRDDYGSFHDNGKTMNTVGTVVSMPGRHLVDDDRHRTCSHGLHFCSWDYLPQFMGERGRVLVLAIDPADVVAIPSDYNNAKGRAWKYEVIGEVPLDKAEHAFPNQSRAVNIDRFKEWQQAVVDGDTRDSYDEWLDEQTRFDDFDGDDDVDDYISIDKCSDPDCEFCHGDDDDSDGWGL